jgi:transcriptional regulator with XRE-family HTH domain
VRTRIRHYRRLRRLTQADLAERIGTTAATISRLETADMKVSMNWLQRFADIFNIPIADLIEEPKLRNSVPCVGEISRSGALSSIQSSDEKAVTIEAPARDPIALRIRENVGTYCAGDVVIADRMSPEHASRALGRDCLIEVDGEASGFGRFISSADGRYLLVPPEPGAQARPLPTPDWIAPVVMLIRYL